MLRVPASLDGPRSTANAQRSTKMTIATGVDPAFSQFYVAKEAGLFEKNGLDVTINTGPSGSAMVPFLINNQVQAAYGSDLAGVINHQVDNNIVAVADGTYLSSGCRWSAATSPTLDGLKGKKVGIAKGTGSEIFWSRVVEKLKLNAGRLHDRRMSRRPRCWPPSSAATSTPLRSGSRGRRARCMTVKDTKILQTAEGIYNNINFVYMNRGWIEKNKATAEKFI